jgi:hypothetical protein
LSPLFVPVERVSIMAEVLVQFDPPVTDEAGRSYVVRICGRPTESGLWEGWIEFEPLDGERTLRTPRETEQPNRADLAYWATGLTTTYLEGALERARRPRTPDLRQRSVEAYPTYDGPAPAFPERASEAVPQRPRVHGILDPFKVYAQGEDILRKELNALGEGHLRTIIREHELVHEDELDLESLHRPALAELIVSAVRKRVG